MNAPSTPAYQFGDFYLDPSRRQLTLGGQHISLTPKAFDTLLILVSRGGRVVRKEELLSEVWPDTFVEEATLAQNVFTLRKALAKACPDEQFIETVQKHGYRFVAEVRELNSVNVVLERRTTTRIVTEEIEEGEFVPSSPPPIKLATSPTHSGRIVVVALAVLWAGVVTYFAVIAPLIKKTVKPMRISSLTQTGQVLRTAISPDGKYVVNALKDGELESLMVRQVTASTNLQIVSPAAFHYQGVTFSNDSNFVFYAGYEKGNPVGALYRVPALGGTPDKILIDIDSPVAFSADGKKVAFVRNNPQQNTASLLIANADGSEERPLATRALPDFFSLEGAAWSPDGIKVICAVGRSEFNRIRMGLVEFQIDGSSNRTFSANEWDVIGQVAWASRGNAILIDGWKSSASLLSSQIWSLSYPGGEAKRITNDLNSYHGISLTKNNDALVTVRASRAANFWVAPGDDINHAQRITSGAGDLVGEVMGLSWTPDGRIVYGSSAGDGLDVWSMNADGSNPKQLTTDAPYDLKPAVSPDGRYVAFVSWRGGISHLWRMDVDGANVKQLTNGPAESYPTISPDSRWVIFLSAEQNKSSLWKVAIDGGEPVRLRETWTMAPSVSPDGKLIASFAEGDQANPFTLVLFPFDGGEPVKSFNVPASVFLRGGLRWSADGKAVSYIDNRGGVSNIWKQPIDGNAPQALTSFTTDRIFRFDWSRDGKHLAFERGMNIDDTTLIENFAY